MQYTYEEAVRELSDFIGKNVTSENHYKLEQIFTTVLKGNGQAHFRASELAYDTGWDDAKMFYNNKEDDNPYSMDGG